MMIPEELTAYDHLTGVEAGLFIGDLLAADWALGHSDWAVLNVLEGGDRDAYHGRDDRLWLPILEYDRPSGQVRARPAALNVAASWIQRQREQRRRPVLVHCAAGVERSPLTVAWYLARRHNWSLGWAYHIIQAQRQIVENREAWLPAGWEAWLRQ